MLAALTEGASFPYKSPASPGLEIWRWLTLSACSSWSWWVPGICALSLTLCLLSARAPPGRKNPKEIYIKRILARKELIMKAGEVSPKAASRQEVQGGLYLSGVR